MQSNEFMVGDRVRCISEPEHGKHIISDMLYEVTAVDGDFISVNGGESGWDYTRFVLDEETFAQLLSTTKLLMVELESLCNLSDHLERRIDLNMGSMRGLLLGTTLGETMTALEMDVMIHALSTV